MSSTPKEDERISCPKCNKELQLKQINFESAVYICPDLKCPYPVGDKCVTVQRNFRLINKKPQPLSADVKEQLFKEVNSEPVKDEHVEEANSSSLTASLSKDDENIAQLLTECDTKLLESFDVKEIDDFLTDLLN